MAAIDLSHLNANSGINNKIARLQQYGYSAEPEQSFIEKTLNLPADSGVLEKILNLLPRTEAASASLLGGLNEGAGLGESLNRVKESIQGKRKYSYTDLLGEQFGMSGAAKNILGLGLGTILDPTTYIPVAGATKFAKKIPGVKQGLGLVGKGTKGLLKAGKQNELLKPFIEGTEGLAKYGQKLFGGEKFSSPEMEKLAMLYGGGITGRQGMETAQLMDRFNPLFKSVYRLPKKQSTDIFNRAIERADLTGLSAKNKKIAEGLMDFFETTGLTKKKIKVIDNLVGAGAKVGNKTAGLAGGWKTQEAMAYFPHIMTDEYREMLLKQGKVPEDTVQTLIGLSRRGIARKEKERTLKGMADTLNAQSRKQFGFNIFETDIKKVLSKYTYNYTRNKSLVDVANETLKLTDESGNLLIKSLKKGAKDAPEGMVKLSGLPYKKGYYTTPEAAQQINRAVGMLSSSADFNKFVKAFDKGMGLWKKGVTQFNPGFYFNNLLGAEFNIAIKDFAAMKEFGKAVSLAKGKEMSKFITSKTGKSLTGKEFDTLITKMGAFTNLVGPENAAKGLFSPDRISARFNNSIEAIVRRQTALAEFKKTGSIEKAVKAVWEVHGNYNPEAMGTIERTVVKRAVPFLNWAKTNIPFQIKSLYQKTGKYATLARAQNQAVPLEERAKLPSWMRNLPLLPGQDVGGGDKNYTSLNLPIVDLNDVTDWKKLIGNRLSPAVKSPIELLANKNLYFDRPIVDKDLPVSMQKAAAPAPEVFAKLAQIVPGFKEATGYQEYNKTNEASGKTTKRREINAQLAYLVNLLGPVNKFGNIPKIQEETRKSLEMDTSNIDSILAALGGLIVPWKPNMFNPLEQEASEQNRQEALLQARINYLLQRGLIPRLK